MIIITGSNHGIGFSAASALAGQGAGVIMAVRSLLRGEKAAERIRHIHPSASLTVMELDLASLASVQDFASRYRASFDRLDVLINNAGVMTPPYGMTRDGFELQFGINHLGHFALTSHLLPLLMATPLSRVVTVSSIAARRGMISFDNLDGSGGYYPMRFYRQSKFANLLFALELQNRLEHARAMTISVACHPGLSTTNILSRNSGKEVGRILRSLMGLVAQSADMGALPTLFAALHPDIRGGEFIGPGGPGNRKGYPELTGDGVKYFDPLQASQLWDISERLTGCRYNL